MIIVGVAKFDGVSPQHIFHEALDDIACETPNYVGTSHKDRRKVLAFEPSLSIEDGRERNSEYFRHLIGAWLKIQMA